MTRKQSALVHAALDRFALELPCWAFGDAGGRARHDAAAIDLNDALADAGEVHRLTGCCPAVALDAQRDLEAGADPALVARLASRQGLRIASVRLRQRTPEECLRSIRLGQEAGAHAVWLRVGDGAPLPGREVLAPRKDRLDHDLRAFHRRLASSQTLLVECGPFGPSASRPEAADWGIACVLAHKAGPRAKVLVDTGHQAVGQNIARVVSFLLEDGKLGGIRFDDRRYAEDTTLGAVQPYRAFRIFHEVLAFGDERGSPADPAYTVEAPHEDGPRTEAVLQAVLLTQELFAKAALVDHVGRRDAHARRDPVAADRTLQEAFFADLGAVLAEWRQRRGLPADPLGEHRRSGYELRAASARRRRREDLHLAQAGVYPAAG